MKRLALILILFTAVSVSCRKDRLPPSAACTAFPLVCDTTTLFEFDASKSINNQGFSSGLSYRWDFENDGIWDTDWRAESGASHRFLNPGKYKVVVEVADFAGISDTASVGIETFGRNKDISSMQDPRDGHIYGIAKFRGYWWMRENLVYGKVLDPMEWQTDNGIVEQFFGVNPGSTDTVFGLYDWREAMNYDFLDQGGICPPGWHIPSVSEWKVLLKDFPAYYAGKLYGKNGLSELNLQAGNSLSGQRGPDPSLAWVGIRHEFWARDYKREDFNHIYLGFFSFGSLSSRTSGNPVFATSEEDHELFLRMDMIHLRTVRCIKKE
jgi:uncharacterized protein (TIGR02145 family)